MPATERLLVVTESFGIGGTESHLIRLLPLLADSGLDVAVFCMTERGGRAGELERAGVKLFTAREQSGRHGTLLRQPAHVAIAALKLRALMRRFDPHIVHFYLPGPYLIGAPVALVSRAPLKIMSRRSLSRYQRNWPAVARIERLLHRRMDAVTGNSRAVVKELSAEGIPETKLRLIYNGIDIAPEMNRSEARRALGLSDDALVGVMVANLIPYKGHHDLIEGLAGIAGQLPADWRVLLAGRDEGLRFELEALAAERSIGENVVFLGERSDVPRLLAAADFGLLTSHEEGFSNVVLEGMAAALPMIVTDVGGNAEAVLDGETGLVVQPRNPKSIGEAVLQLAGDARLRTSLGQAGQKRVVEHFSMEACLRAHLQLYRALLAARFK
jgi:glycosyltransferase involved in cell wall biosynthesis